MTPIEPDLDNSSVGSRCDFFRYFIKSAASFGKRLFFAMSIYTEQAAADLAAVRCRCPRVHCIMNSVTAHFVAGSLLSLGVSPVMARDEDEAAEMAAGADAFVLNLGTLQPAWMPAILKAGRKALAAGIPRVLDPVGAGATEYRTRCARKMLREIQPTVVRGNATEILALIRRGFSAKGVDSRHAVEQAAEAACRVAQESGAVVVVSGPADLVTDGRRGLRVVNGHPLMQRITGSGCAAGAVVAAFLAVDDVPLNAAAAAMACYAVAGEIAAGKAFGPGSLVPEMIDTLFALTPEHLIDGAKIESI